MYVQNVIWGHGTVDGVGDLKRGEMEGDYEREDIKRG